MNSARMQHIIPATIILALSVVVAYLSFTQQPVESFLFPRIISVAFVGLAVWNFIRAVTGMAKVGRGISKQEFNNVLPGLTVMLIYVFWAAKGWRSLGQKCVAALGENTVCTLVSKGLGFYTASALAFFIIYTLYDPAPRDSVKDWGKRIVVTLGFMLVIYGLFKLILQVQTPRGLFF